MLNKVSSLARVVGIVLAIVAGFVALGTLDTTLVLVVLGLIAGLSLTADRMVLTGVMVLVLPTIGAALAIIPGIGAQLLAVTGNLAMLAAASLGTAFALVIYERVKSDLGSLTAK